jgi:cellulose synthase/poly-beta-1,6-N-acetylglucosamine synthase-like glycosyltransferase
MVFPFAFVKSVLKEIQAIGGFDKVLQTMVPEKGYRIHYLEHALIFDEKVENQQAFSNQRRRWVSAQVVYLRKFFPRGLKALMKGNFDTFNMAVGHNLLVPRTLLLMALVVITLLSLAIGTPLVYGWAGITVAFMISLLLPLPARFFTHYFFTAVLALPKVLGLMFGLLFKLKGANNTFIHTKHSKTGVDNPLINGSSK